MACERPGSTVPLVLVPWELVMPTYEYACIECGHHVEVVQSMSDAPLTECVTCGGRLRKVFSPIGIVFKESGFYRTDSRGKAPAPKDAAAAAAGKETSKAKTSPEPGDGSSKPAEKSA